MYDIMAKMAFGTRSPLLHISGNVQEACATVPCWDLLEGVLGAKATWEGAEM